MHHVCLRLACATASLSLLFPSAANAQSSSPLTPVGTPPEAAVCELHVWATDKFAVTENFKGANYGLIGGLTDEAMRLKSPEGVADQLRTQLSPSAQGLIIKEVGLAALFHLSGYRVVIESADSQPMWTLEQLKTKERMSKVPSDCYAEMVIISQQYLKQPIGTRLRTFISYKEFGSSSQARLKVQDTTATQASDFPSKTVDGVAASTASLQGAFRENLLKFAKDKLKR